MKYKDYTARQMAVTDRHSFRYSIVEWTHKVEPMMIRFNYTGNVGKSRFYREAIQHFLVHLAEQDAAINNAGLIPQQHLIAELDMALAKAEDKEK